MRRPCPCTVRTNPPHSAIGQTASHTLHTPASASILQTANALPQFLQFRFPDACKSGTMAHDHLAGQPARAVILKQDGGMLICDIRARDRLSSDRPDGIRSNPCRGRGSASVERAPHVVTGTCGSYANWPAPPILADQAAWKAVVPRLILLAHHRSLKRLNAFICRARRDM